MLRRFFSAALAIGFVLHSAGGARAQNTTAPDTTERIERLEKQNQELLLMLQKMQNGAAVQVAPAATVEQAPSAASGAPKEAGTEQVKKVVNDVLKEKEETKKKEEAAAKAKADDEGYKIGTDLNLKATWSNGLLLSTPNKDFTMHIGAWTMLDNVFFTQSPALKTGAGRQCRPGSENRHGR